MSFHFRIPPRYTRRILQQRRASPIQHSSHPTGKRCHPVLIVDSTGKTNHPLERAGVELQTCFVRRRDLYYRTKMLLTILIPNHSIKLTKTMTFCTVRCSVNTVEVRECCTRIRRAGVPSGELACFPRNSLKRYGHFSSSSSHFAQQLLRTVVESCRSCNHFLCVEQAATLASPGSKARCCRRSHAALPFFTPRFPLLFPPSRPREWKAGQEVCREVGEHELVRTTVRTNAIGTPSSLPSPQKHTNLTHGTAAILFLFQSPSLSSVCHCSCLLDPSTG